MASEFILSCESTADLTEKHFKDIGVDYICFHFELDGIPYTDDMGRSMSYHDFYQAMRDGADTKTSQVNADEFIDFFEPFLKEGRDILHVCLSSGLTSVMNSANIAKNELEEKYPDRKIYIADSLGASSGYGLIMDTLAKMRSDGTDIETLYKWVETHKLNMHHWFFSTDLTFYVKGGRISKASGWFGGVLGICPLLNMDYAGHLIPRKKLRGKNKVIHAIVEEMEAHAEDGRNYSGKCYISHSDCMEEAKKVAEMVEERFPELNGNVEINDVGTTIGSHTGPGTVALFFWGDERNE